MINKFADVKPKPKQKEIKKTTGTYEDWTNEIVLCISFMFPMFILFF